MFFDRPSAGAVSVALMLACATAAVPAGAAPQHAAELRIVPVQCVALHRGQNCYYLARVSWNTPLSAEYCLYREDQAAALHCWRNADQGQIELRQETARTLTYELRAAESGQVLATAQIEIAWVYQAERRALGSWRLF